MENLNSSCMLLHSKVHIYIHKSWRLKSSDPLLVFSQPPQKEKSSHKNPGFAVLTQLFFSNHGRVISHGLSHAQLVAFSPDLPVQLQLHWDHANLRPGSLDLTIGCRAYKVGTTTSIDELHVPYAKRGGWCPRELETIENLSHGLAVL